MDPKLKPLTEQQELLGATFIAKKLAGEKIDDETAKEIGYKSAAAAERALQNPVVKSHVVAELDRAGATLGATAKVIAEAHEAKEIKFFSYEGVVRDQREVVDHSTRLRAAELNLEVRGELKQAGVNVTFNKFGELTDEQLAKIALGQEVPTHLLPQGIIDTTAEVSK